MRRIPFRLEDTQEYQEFLRQQQAISPAAEDALLPAPDERQAVVNPQGVYEPMDPMRFYSGAMGDPALLNQPMYQAAQAAGRGISAAGNLASRVFLEPVVNMADPMAQSMQGRLPQTSVMPAVSEETMASMTPFQQMSYQAMQGLSDPSVMAPAAVSMMEPTPFEAAMAGTVVGAPVALASKMARGAAKGASAIADALKAKKLNPAKVPMPARPATVVKTVQRDGGITINPYTGEMPTSGVMVGRYANMDNRTVTVPANKFNQAVVSKFYLDNQKELAKPGRYVGIWNDTSSNQVYLDVAQRFTGAKAGKPVNPALARRQAVKFGEAQAPNLQQPDLGQKAVYDIGGGATVPVGNVVQFSQSPEFQQRMDDMFAVGSEVMEQAGSKPWWSLKGGRMERVYGEEQLPTVAGYVAATSPATDPVENVKRASEYMRREIKGEPVIQPDYRRPDTAMGRPGKQIGLEAGLRPNLLKVREGRPQEIRKDKVNDMFHALMGEDVGVYDRHWAKLVEDPARGIYAENAPNVISGAMDGAPELYAWIDNAVRDGAKRQNLPVSEYSARIWEGIRETIRSKGELYGTKYRAEAIPEYSGGIDDVFGALVKAKAKHLKISVEEMERRLKAGDAELLSALLATPSGFALYRFAAGMEPTRDTSE